MEPYDRDDDKIFPEKFISGIMNNKRMAKRLNVFLIFLYLRRKNGENSDEFNLSANSFFLVSSN